MLLSERAIVFCDQVVINVVVPVAHPAVVLMVIAVIFDMVSSTSLHCIIVVNIS